MNPDIITEIFCENLSYSRYKPFVDISLHTEVSRINVFFMIVSNNMIILTNRSEFDGNRSVKINFFRLLSRGRKEMKFFDIIFENHYFEDNEFLFVSTSRFNLLKYLNKVVLRSP